ncbi:V-type ATP synthase subunit I [Candidatus Nanosalina sp. VS9-1]|uniref:V-type ATP synthase subunit I n=1 Tax=Candidatus Nanosalina sp. VS9-1 TaxID=3388566 RepID=UPI0039E05570
MTKVSITGPKTQLDRVITTLYDLEVLDIDDYSGEMLEKGEPFKKAEDLSQLLVDVRSLKSKLPEIEYENGNGFSLENIQDSVEEINEEVDSLTAERDSIKTDISNLNDHIRFFKHIKGCDLKYSDLAGSENLDVIAGKFDREGLTQDLGDDSYDIFEGSQASVVVFSNDSGLDSRIRNHLKEEYSVPELDVSGFPSEVIDDLRKRRKELKQSRRSLEKKIEDIARDWYPRLDGADEFLTEKVEKAEAPIRFGTTDKAFVAQGWIPSEQFEEVEEILAEACEGKIHIQKEDDDQEPPVKHDNAGPVKPFESLTDLVSVPRYNELDPSIVLMLTFPLFFGFMIGDAGYGLTTFLVFYGGMKVFPQAKEIFKSLMYASVATFLFGLAFGDAFGYVIFGHHSELAAATGIHLFEQIPILWHRAEHLGQVFNIAAMIGLVHVNIGYLIGGYNEYVNHGLKEAFLEKGSWLVLQIGALMTYFYGATVGGPVLALSVVLLFVGEGVEGLVEIPSLISNILSYLRIFGVSVAAVVLAQVVNSMAQPLLTSGSVVGLTAGIGLLVFGHVFNTFVKIMEGFLQGIRLHYVEMFNKFYEGGGRKYLPFGAE